MLGSPQNVLDVRRSNRSTILRHIYFHAPISRLQISQLSGLSPGTVTNVINELLDLGLVIESGSVESAGGRPSMLLSANPTYSYLVGVTVRPSYFYVELFDFTLRSVGKAVHTWPWGQAAPPPDQIVDLIDREFHALLGEAGKTKDQIIGVGVGVSAVVNPDTGTLFYAPLIGWTEPIPLRKMLVDKLQLPMYVENGARTVVFAEALARPAQHQRSLATLMLSTGIGAAIIMKGELYRGATNSAGSWGHTCLVRDGRVCPCGNRGCLEAYIGAPGIIQTYNEFSAESLALDDERAAIRLLLALAKRGDLAAARTLQETTHALGIGVANFINMFDPQLIVIGGWVGLIIGEYILEDLRAVIAGHVYLKPLDTARVSVSKLGLEAFTKGPAALVLDRFLRTLDRTLDSVAKLTLNAD
jgi:predicted NBD/HSP70 family sugar kinase